MKFKKKIAGLSACAALAAGLVLGIASPASAGTCSSVSQSNGTITGNCKGTTTFTWYCSTDLFNTKQTKTVSFPSNTYSTKTFKACNAGFAYGGGWS